MALFIMFIPLPVEAKVKEEEKRSAVSVSFLFSAYTSLRIPELIHPNCSMWQNTHWFVSQWSLLLGESASLEKSE